MHIKIIHILIADNWRSVWCKEGVCGRRDSYHGNMGNDTTLQAKLADSI